MILAIYLAGALLTTATTAAVGLNQATASGGVGAAFSSTPNPLFAGATWPLSLPVLAAAGVGTALQPDEPENIDCQTHQIPLAEIEGEGGHAEFATGAEVLRLSKIIIPLGEHQFTARVNWRGGAHWEDQENRLPSITADWMGDDVDAAGEPVSSLRVCTLKPLHSAAGGAQ